MSIMTRQGNSVKETIVLEHNAYAYADMPPTSRPTC